MKEKLETRLSELKKWIRNGNWYNSASPEESNGYDAHVKDEIEFLESLLKETKST